MKANRIGITLAAIWTAAFCLVGLTGCSTVIFAWDDAAVRIRDECRARKAWHASRSIYDDLEHHWSFGNGFKAGYVSVAAGGDGSPPCLPPRHYWWSRFQNPTGRARIQAWYDGHAHGALAAQCDGVSIRNQLGCHAHCYGQLESPSCDYCDGPTADPWGGEIILDDASPQGPSFQPDAGTPFQGTDEFPPEVPPAPDENQWRPTPQPAPIPRVPDHPYIEPESMEPETIEEAPTTSGIPRCRPLTERASYRSDRRAQSPGTRSIFNSAEWMLPLRAGGR